jgi:hypothetical protein
LTTFASLVAVVVAVISLAAVVLVVCVAQLQQQVVAELWKMRSHQLSELLIRLRLVLVALKAQAVQAHQVVMVQVVQ